MFYALVVHEHFGCSRLNHPATCTGFLVLIGLLCTSLQVELCNILEVVVDNLKNANCSYLFQKPVPKKDAPDYLHYVKRPMDLSTIRERVRKLKYKSRREFRQDVQQISDNAHIYNDNRNPGIPPLADRLLELCDEELVARGVELDEAESGIEPVEEEPRVVAATSQRHDRRRSVHMF